MTAPTSGSLTTQKVIDIVWTAVTSPNDGGSSVTSYNLYWDQGYSSWTTVVGQYSDYTGTSYLIGIGLTAGNSYSFKVRAKNKWGFGSFSSVTSIVACGTPGSPTVTTSIVSSSGDVKISWTKPAINGADISAYLI